MITYEMLPQQKNIYNIEKAFRGTGICNLGGLVTPSRYYDVNIIKRACEEIISNNSVFSIKVNSEGKIYFDDDNTIVIEEVDFTGKNKEEINVIFADWMNTSIFREDSFLFDIKIIRFKDKNSIYARVHHLIFDGFSVALFTKEFDRVCSTLENGEYAPKVDTQYADKIISYNSDLHVSGDALHKNCRVEDDCVSFDSEMKQGDADVVSAILAADYCEADKNAAVSYSGYKKYLKKINTSAEAMVYGALTLYFGRIQNKKKMIIGRNLLNRSGKEFTVMGLQVLLAPFECILDEDSTVGEYYSGLKKKLAVNAKDGAGEHYTAPDVIVSYRLNKLMQSLDNGECIEYISSYCEVPLKVFINEKNNQIELQFKYQKNVFEKDDIIRACNKVMHIIRQSVADSQQKMQDIKLLEAWEEDLINDFNDSHVTSKQESLPVKMIKNVLADGEKTALIYKGEKYSYKDVYEMVMQASEWITENADKSKEKIVCVCLERSMWHPVILYAAWIAGYAYLPVSEKDSKEKNERVFDKCAVVIDKAIIGLFENNKGVGRDGEYNLRDGEADADGYAGIIESRLNDVAYYMFTSGTTGRPKAVEITHDSLLKRIAWMAQEFEDGMEVVLHKTNSTFDVSMWELALPWAYGKTMCVACEGDEKNPEKLVSLLVNEHVTMVHFVPSMFQAFLNYVIKNKCTFSDLKYIVMSGERLDASLVNRAYEHMDGTGNISIYNLYGPTECTIDVSYFKCDKGRDNIPIGTPVADTGLTVRNSNHCIMPVGVVGELVIEGDLVGNYSDGLSGGFKEIDGKRYYYTGDMAHLSADGYMYYDGRRDNRTKIRGMRVNIDEIEMTLNNHFAGSRHVILCINDKLIDFYEGNILKKSSDKNNIAGKEEDRATINDLIKKHFPYYYIPSEIIKIDNLPVKQQGKVDKNKLIEIYEQKVATQSLDGFVTGGEENTIWEVARIQNILRECASKYVVLNDDTTELNLIEAGMDSLNTLNFLADCEEYGLNIPYDVFLRAPDIVRMSEYIYDGRLNISDEVLIYYSEEEREELVLMVPFAGGTPLTFGGLSRHLDKEKYDKAVVNMPSMEDCSLEEICKKVLGEIEGKQYGKIHIIGSCVGSTLAVMMNKELGERAGNLIICESLPYYGINALGKHFTIWDVMPDFLISLLLQRIRGRKFRCDRQLLSQFRKDVRKSSFALGNLEAYSPHGRVAFIFGEKDVLTQGYRVKVKRWKKILNADVGVYTIEQGSHFIVEDHAKEVAGIIRDILLRNALCGDCLDDQIVYSEGKDGE